MFIDQFAPKYKLIKNIIYHILGRYDVHDGLRCIVEVFDYFLMRLRVVAHWEAGLHVAVLIPDLDLRHGQGHRRATANAMKGDLLDAHREVVEAGIDEGAPCVNGRRSHIRCQLEVLQLDRQGW